MNVGADATHASRRASLFLTRPSHPHPAYIMEAADREDVPRISVDNLYDWERIKKSYEDAAYAQLDARTKGQPKEDRERLRAAMQKASFSRI